MNSLKDLTIYTEILKECQIYHTDAIDLTKYTGLQNSDKQGVGDIFTFLEILLGETAANIYNEAKVKKAE